MGAVTVAEMREIEGRAMRAGITEGELMKRAGVALGKAIGAQYPRMRAAVAYIGKGHNAGDALIALRVLQRDFGWETGVRSAYPEDDWAELTRRQWEASGLERTLAEPPTELFLSPVLLMDGLLGIGAKGALREPLAGLAREMDHLRNTRGFQVAAVDLPSGVDPDSGEVFPGAVTADRTFMIGEAKRGLLMGCAANSTGALSLVDVQGLSGEGGDMEMICPQRTNYGKAPRPFDFHKGKAGRVGILAGSPEFTGAALISTVGAIQAGGGLVTLCSPSAAGEAIRARLPLEAMFKPCDDPASLLDERFDAIVIGPGLGKMSGDFERGLMTLITATKIPVVIDADGLNLISKHGLATDDRHILTPHPGEFERLAGAVAEQSREKAVRAFSSKTASVLLLKGARTIISQGKRNLRINSTGDPAMSNGGQGDLLSGVIGALLASGMDPFNAASLGAWQCGRAAELFVGENGSPSKATDVAEKLGLALRDWSECRR